MNFSDSERLFSFLEKNNLKPTETIDQADLVIFNTCGVRQSAENRVYGQIHNLRKKNKSAFIILTGCLAHRKDVQQRLHAKVNLFISIGEFFKLDFKNFKLKIKSKKIPAKQQPKIKDFTESKLIDEYLKIAPLYANPKKILIPIMTGCNNFCSYCVVPYARGRERSRSPMDILAEITQAQANDCQEVMLLGQNVNSYIYPTKHLNLKNHPALPIKKLPQITFPILLDYLAKTFPKINFKFLTSHPKDFSDELIKVIAQYKNIPPEIHLPLQSGADKILKDMNRPYTKKEYLSLIKKLRQKIPQIKITTDMIVGFPTETEKEFQETIKTFQQIKFNDAYINKYSPRPETTAEKLGDPIPWEEKKRRARLLKQLLST